MRHRYDGIIMGFMERRCLDSGLQAKAADRWQAPSLSYFQPIRIQGVPDDIVLKRAFRCTRPFRSLTITLFTSLVWTNFQHFPPPPLPPACELIPSLFLFIVLVGDGFFPHLYWRGSLLYIADLENKVRHLWWPNFLQPNSTLCLPPQQTSAPPRRALGHAKFSASLNLS